MTNLSTLRNALQAFDFNTVTPYAVGSTELLIGCGIMQHIKQSQVVFHPTIL